MKRLHDDSGQVLIISALCMTCLLGFVGVAVDVGLLLREKRLLQTAADSAAIAGAAELINGDVTAGAKADASLNGVTDGVNGATVAVSQPKAGYVQVIASQSQPTFFMRLFGRTSMTVSARAVAATVPSPSCVYTLTSTGTDINLTGSGSMTLPNCGIMDNSSDPQALNLTGSGNITAQSIGIVGNYNKTGSGIISPTPVIHMASVSDPLSSISPPTFLTSSCVADPNFTGSAAQTVGPAVANGTICYNGFTTTGSGNITFNPGLYIINGDFTATGSGNLTGTGGVTFYLPSNGDNLKITGSGDLNFTAPTSGPYSGLLFYQNSNDQSTDSFTGSASSVLNGIFYLPAAQLNMTGSGGSRFNTDLVVGSLNITGSLPLSDYVPAAGASPLSNPRLVE